MIFQPGGDHDFKNDIDSEANRQYTVLDSISMPYQIPLKNFLVWIIILEPEKSEKLNFLFYRDQYGR